MTVRIVAVLLLAATASGADRYQVHGLADVSLVVERDGSVSFERAGRTLIPEHPGTLRIEGARIVLGESVVGELAGGVAFIGAGPHRRSATVRIGRKVADDFGPRAVVESVSVVPVVHLEPDGATRDDLPPTFDALVPLVQACPDQDEAGSCLYMALTGAAEMALAQANPAATRVHDGDLDLSERFLMNAGSRHAVANWLTDSIQVFNLAGGGLRNRDYRFTKGFYEAEGDDLRPSAAGAAGASYGTRFNWIDGLTPDLLARRIDLPRMDRRVVYEDPNHDQWATGRLADGHVEEVKRLLVSTRRPVQVLYNHFGYWHCVLVVGYDDTRACDGGFVTRWVQYTAEQADQMLASTEERERARGQRWKGYVDAVRANIDRHGLTRGRGVFLVRDSIYEGPADDLYDYDTSRTGDEAPYAARIIERDDAWLKHLANHVVLIQY